MAKKSTIPVAKEYTTLEGILKRVSQPYEYDLPDRKGTLDYFTFGFKTQDDKRVMFTLNTTALGWTGDPNRSKVWYYNKNKKRELQTVLSQPEMFVGKPIRVTGFFEIINEKGQKYRLRDVQRLVLFVD